MGHLKQNCRSSGCRKCHQKHNTTLHYDRNISQNEVKSQSAGYSPQEPTSSALLAVGQTQIEESQLQPIETYGNNGNLVSQNTTLSYAISDTTQVLLSKAIILIADIKGCWHQCNALLDSGSQSNLISQSLCEKLNLGL